LTAPATSDFSTLSLHDALPICPHARVASTSISILTFLPTTTPPVSRAWFQVTPKSSRSIWVVAEKATLSLPHGSVTPPENSTSRSEEHTSELQSLAYLVCRLLL